MRRPAIATLGVLRPILRRRSWSSSSRSAFILLDCALKDQAAKRRCCLFSWPRQLAPLGQSRRGDSRPATTCCCWPSSTRPSSPSASVTLLVIFGAMVGFVLQRRPPGWNSVVNACVLAGPHHPAGRRADDLGAAGPGPVQDPARHDPDRGRLRPVLLVLLFRAFVATIPRELDEAAIIDGAGRCALFFRVILPLLRPVVVTRDRGAVGRDLQRLHQPALLSAGQGERHGAADALQLPEPVQAPSSTCCS